MTEEEQLKQLYSKVALEPLVKLYLELEKLSIQLNSRGGTSDNYKEEREEIDIKKSQIWQKIIEIIS